MKNIPRQYALVKIEPEHKKRLEANASDSILLKEKAFIFLGEIPNMPEHCVVAGKDSGKIFSGYDIDNFKELSGDEV